MTGFGVKVQRAIDGFVVDLPCNSLLVVAKTVTDVRCIDVATPTVAELLERLAEGK